MPPKKSAAQRLRQQALPGTLKTVIGSYLAPKTPARTLDRVLTYAYRRLVDPEPGQGWVMLYARSGIEIEIIRRTGATVVPHYRLNINLSVHNSLLGQIEREASRTEILRLTEASAIQILYILRTILTRFALVPLPNEEYAAGIGGAEDVRRVTMLRALDVVRPTPATEKTLSFVRLFRP